MKMIYSDICFRIFFVKYDIMVHMFQEAAATNTIILTSLFFYVEAITFISTGAAQNIFLWSFGSHARLSDG